MSSFVPPEPTGPPGPPDPSGGATPPAASPLSIRERDVLARVSAAEYLADPRFANDLAAGRVHDAEGRSPRRVAVAGVLLVAAVLVGLLASMSIVLGVALAVVVALTVGLVGWVRSQERRRR